MQDQNQTYLLIIPIVIAVIYLYQRIMLLSEFEKIAGALALTASIVMLVPVLFYWFSQWGRNQRKLRSRIKEIPAELLTDSPTSIRMGPDRELGAPIYLSDEIRSRHVHIIGATGSGKTESVVLNFLKQDVKRGLGSIVLDAKGDDSFMKELRLWVPADRLRIFDLGSDASLSYDPLEDGTPLEAAQRLFSSLVWSEEYYKSKALSALQRLFQAHFDRNDRNPKLLEIAGYLDRQEVYTAFVNSVPPSIQVATKEFQDLTGLRDQVHSLRTAHLSKILSSSSGIKLNEAQSGQVIYFRLQSLMSPQLATTVGKLIINHLGFLAGSAHRVSAKRKNLVPVYFDEFASFACLEFADLISKARSAGFALHFSHQSVGDIIEVSAGFLNRITDNAATKIVLRINDPDSAEFFARCFGTKEVQKTTQRITNAKNIDRAEVIGEGTTRDSHKFRIGPDLFKTLPTGIGAVLVAHGKDTPQGASAVFQIKFPRLSTAADI